MVTGTGLGSRTGYRITKYILLLLLYSYTGEQLGYADLLYYSIRKPLHRVENLVCYFAFWHPFVQLYNPLLLHFPKYPNVSITLCHLPLPKVYWLPSLSLLTFLRRTI